MRKDMYDDKGNLRIEYLMRELYDECREAQIKCEKANIAWKKAVNKLLEQKREYNLKYKISFETFEGDYNYFKYAISNGLVDNCLPFALALLNAKIFPAETYMQEEKLNTYMEDLENIIASEIRKFLIDDGMALTKELNNMQSNITQYVITLNDYCNYCEKLELAMMAKLDGINYLELARTLQNARVESPKTYDEHIKYNSFSNKLSAIITKLEQHEKDAKRK